MSFILFFLGVSERRTFDFVQLSRQQNSQESHLSYFDKKSTTPKPKKTSKTSETKESETKTSKNSETKESVSKESEDSETKESVSKESEDSVQKVGEEKQIVLSPEDLFQTEYTSIDKLANFELLDGLEDDFDSGATNFESVVEMLETGCQNLNGTFSAVIDLTGGMSSDEDLEETMASMDETAYVDLVSDEEEVPEIEPKAEIVVGEVSINVLPPPKDTKAKKCLEMFAFEIVQK